MAVDVMIVDILAVCGVIAAVGGAGAVVFKFLSPAFRLVRRVEELERRSVQDYGKLQKRANFDQASAKALIAILEHLKEGNHTGEMATASKDLQIFLAEN